MWRVLLAGVVIVASSGCARSAKLAGKVSYRGQPVLSGCVTIVNEDGTASSGVIQPDGTYAVEGVKRGHVKIAVVSPDPARARSILNTGDAKEAHEKDSHAHTKPGTGGWFPLPAVLGNPDTSGLELDVKSSRAQYDIDVK
jgi:hypothetical protein